MMKKLAALPFLLVVISAVMLQNFTMAAGGSLERPIRAPEFTHTSPTE